MDPAPMDMIAKTHNAEKVQLRMRIAELEALLRETLDPIEFANGEQSPPDYWADLERRIRAAVEPTT